MKEKIHPKWFEATVVCSCGNTFKTGSTRDKLHVEICSACHPFFTGNQKFVDTEGRVEKFMTKFGTVTSQKSKRKAKAEADAKAKAEAEAAAAAQAPAAQAHVEAVAEPATKKAAAKPKSTTPRRRTKAAKAAEESAEPEKVPAETPAS